MMKLKNLFKYTDKDKATIFLFFGMFAFFIGFHNVDLSQNFMRIDLMMGNDNQTLVETNGCGMEFSLENTYRLGCMMMLFSVPCLFLAGYYFSRLKNNDEIIIRTKDPTTDEEIDLEL